MGPRRPEDTSRGRRRPRSGPVPRPPKRHPVTLSRRAHKVATNNVVATLHSSCDFILRVLLSSVERSKKPRPVPWAQPRRRTSRDAAPSPSEGRERPLRYNHYIHDSNHPERFLVLSPRGSRDLHAAFLRIALGIADTPARTSFGSTSPACPVAGFVSNGFGFAKSSRRTSRTASRSSLSRVMAWSPTLRCRQRQVPRQPSISRGEGVRTRRRVRSGALGAIDEILRCLESARQSVVQQGRRPHPPGDRTAGRQQQPNGSPRARTPAPTRRAGAIAKSSGCLACVSRTSLREIVALSDSLRKPIYYKDRSGRAPDAVELLKRIATTAPRGVAVGGVVAARVHDKSFDLNGIPRVDVVVERDVGLDWIRALDPALQRLPAVTSSPTLVVHPVTRVEITSANSAYPGVPIADPVETLLDLYELRLTEQAEDLIRRAADVPHE